MNDIVCYMRKGKLIASCDSENYTDLEPIYSDSTHGKYIIQHSLIMVMSYIIENTMDNAVLKVEHTVSGGLYCEVYSNVLISKNDIEDINNKLAGIFSEDEKFISRYKTREELLDIFSDNEDKMTALSEADFEGAYLCEFMDIKDYFHTPLVVSAGELKGAYAKYAPPGMIVYASPEFEKVSQTKLFDVFLESEKWAKILNWGRVQLLNKSIQSGEFNHLVHVAEAIHERKIVDIANFINDRRGQIKVITIAGPSSSGKTSFLKRLSVQLRVSGISAIGISLDNYFVNRDKTPLDENGEPDFESIEAIDIDLFNDNMLHLINQEEVELPQFDFQTGSRKKEPLNAKIDKNHIIIIEGIHGLNERLTHSIPKENKLKIYVSALTQINIDNTHRISTTDNRLIRRIVRDYLFRNHTAEQTFEMWKNVRSGEERNIFPFQEQSDVMFNSALLYEFSVLKNFAEPLLKGINESNIYYLDAQRLLFILSYFEAVSPQMIPHTSVLREFIGGSSFDY